MPPLVRPYNTGVHSWTKRFAKPTASTEYAAIVVQEEISRMIDEELSTGDLEVLEEDVIDAFPVFPVEGSDTFKARLV